MAAAASQHSVEGTALTNVCEENRCIMSTVRLTSIFRRTSTDASLQRNNSALRDLTNTREFTKLRVPEEPPAQSVKERGAGGSSSHIVCETSTSASCTIAPQSAFPFSRCLDGATVVREIYEHLLLVSAQHRSSKELKFSSTEISISMRRVLVDWMIEVAEEYKLVPETLFLSVSYTDVCLQKLNIRRSELQLLGVTCVLIAAKYEEIYAPRIDELSYITDHSYTTSEIIEMERTVLKCLGFSVSKPTANTFLSFYLSSIPASERCAHMASFLAELSLMEPDFMHFTPAVVAAAVIFVAEVYLSDDFPQVFQFLDSLDHIQFGRCLDRVHKTFKTYEARSCSALHEKYSVQKYSCVSGVLARGDPVALFERCQCSRR